MGTGSFNNEGHKRGHDASGSATDKDNRGTKQNATRSGEEHSGSDSEGRVVA